MRNLGLAADGIDGHDAALERQRVQQCLDGGNLVALAPRTFLAQAQAARGGKRAHHVQGRVLAIAGTANRLAIQRDDAFDHTHQSRNPVPEALLERLGVQYPKHPAEGVMGRRAMFQHQIPAQPGLVVLGPFRDIHPGIRPTQHRAQRH